MQIPSVLVSILLSTLVLPHLPAQLIVPSASYPTIQSAIDAATPSATIQVLPGVYTENLDTKGKALTLTSVSSPADTIVDGGATAPVLKIVTGEGRSTVVKGLTFRNGVNSSTLPTNGGGGISLIGSSPTILGCRIVGNRCSGYGAGIGGATGTAVCSPLIEDCLFLDNVASGAAYASGAGIALGSGTAAKINLPEVRRCEFRNNVATQRGGGLYLNYYTNALVEDCLFTGNQTIAAGTNLEGGGAIYTSLLSNATFRNNVVVGNSSAGNGGGVKFFNVAASSFVNNTIVGNIGGSVAGFANAGVGGTQVVATFVNCILYDNGPTEISMTGMGATSIPPSANVTYSDVAGGYAGTGNISTPPLLANAASGNVRLLVGSPCIDTGDSSAANLPTKDFEGDPRIVGASVDMGADERVATALLLRADRGTLTLSAPGTTNFTISGGTARSGYTYLLLASLSGSKPGVFLLGKQIPLNPDALTTAISGVFPSWVGPLNASGNGFPTMALGSAPLDPALVGQTLSFAAVAITGLTLDAASNPESIRFVP